MSNPRSFTFGDNGNLTTGDLTFSGIKVSEFDVGVVFRFIADTNPPTYQGAFGPAPAAIGRPLGSGLYWSGFDAGAYGPGSSTTLTFTYSVGEVSNSGQLITG